MKYHNIKHWDNILSSEEIYSEYAKDKTHILNLLQTNPQALINLWQLLGNDNHCQTKMTHYNDFSCVGCQNLTHLIDIEHYVIGEYIESTDGNLLLTKVPVPYTNIVYENHRLKGDAFTMKVLFLWLIEDLFKTIPNAIQLKTAFICNHIGYTLYATNELHPFELIDNYDGILSQLVIIFNELKNINFVLGRPNINSFLFEKKSLSITYQNKKIQSNYIVRLADVAESTAKVNQIYLSTNQFNMNNNNKFIVTRGEQYKLKNNFKIEEIKNKPGLDFYFVLVSMFENDQFRNTIDKDILNQLWDHEEMMKRMDEPDKFENFWLHKDPVSIALNLI